MEVESTLKKSIPERGEENKLPERCEGDILLRKGIHGRERKPLQGAGWILLEGVASWIRGIPEGEGWRGHRDKRTGGEKRR